MDIELATSIALLILKLMTLACLIYVAVTMEKA